MNLGVQDTIPPIKTPKANTSPHYTSTKTHTEAAGVLHSCAALAKGLNLSDLHFHTFNWIWSSSEVGCEDAARCCHGEPQVVLGPAKGSRPPGSTCSSRPRGPLPEAPAFLGVSYSLSHQDPLAAPGAAYVHMLLCSAWSHTRMSWDSWKAWFTYWFMDDFRVGSSFIDGRDQGLETQIWVLSPPPARHGLLAISCFPRETEPIFSNCPSITASRGPKSLESSESPCLGNS